MKIRTIMALASAMVLASATHAASKTFVIGKSGPATSQIATVESSAPLETITGKTSKVTGTVKADTKKRFGSGIIEIDPTSLDTGIALRNGHLQGAMWLDTANNPRIRFESTSVKPLGGDKFSVTGKFTLKGITRTITVPVTSKYLPKSADTVKAGFGGDVLYINTTFDVKMSDYGITIAGKAVGKVADTVKITLTAYGTTA